MADTDHPEEENDWQKIHYSGDDANKKTKLRELLMSGGIKQRQQMVQRFLIRNK